MLPTDHPLLQRHCHVNGKWRDAADGARFPVTDPATGHLIAEVASGTAADAQAALDAAQRAFGPWKDRTATERARALKAWHALLIAHQEDLVDAYQNAMANGVASQVAVTWKRKDGKTVATQVILVPFDVDGERLALHFVRKA